MKNKIYLLVASTFLFSCLEPKKLKSPVDNVHGHNKSNTVIDKTDSSGIAAKNFAQINNTYASLTKVSALETASEYEQIKMQLPSTSDPNSLNGFNQIASTRLAFAYCDKYIDGNTALHTMSVSQAVQSLVDGFVDVDANNNQAHKEFVDELQAILRDDDNIIVNGNELLKTQRRLKLTCTAILASSYVTLI